MAFNAKQYDRPSTGVRIWIILLAAAVIVGAAVIMVGIVYRNTRPYQPPAWDGTAVTGEPSPPEDLGYGVGGMGDGTGFKFGLVSKWVRNGDGSLPVWFTDPAENEAYLMIRIRRASDDAIIYESGLIRPGEYVETLQPRSEPESEPIEVKVSIYSFEPETYHSLGTFNLGGTVE